MFALRRIVPNKKHLFKHLLSTINSENILTSGLPDVVIQDVPIDQYVFEKIGQWEDRIALECAATGRKYTYNELHAKTRNFSRGLRKKLNLKDGDTIAILLPNLPEFPVVALGALNAGLKVTTVNPIYTVDEISKQLFDSNVKAIVTLIELSDVVHKATELLKKQLPIITIQTQQNKATPQGCINYSELADNQYDDFTTSINPHDVAFLPYSSGTTGTPKGVELTQRNIVANLCQLDAANVSICVETTESHQDVSPVILPMFHIYGFTINCLHLLRRGNKVVTFPKFLPDLYVSGLIKHKPDVLFLAPPIAIFLGNHPSVTKKHLSSIRTVMSGAAPLGALDEDKLRNKADKDINIMQGYGMTETSPLVSCTRIGQLISGSIGQVVPNTEVKIVPVDDPTAAPLGPNERGELLIKGPQVMRGYHNKPKETAETFSDGWLRTGDMMYYNTEGYLFVTDRLKELIKVKGYQVAPAELEEVIRDFPNVADAAVIGIPHASHGEVPRAYVVAKPGARIDTMFRFERFDASLIP